MAIKQSTRAKIRSTDLPHIRSAPTRLPPIVDETPESEAAWKTMVNNPDSIIVVDLFCGAGGLSLGFCEAGFSIVAGIDSDAWSCQTHAANFRSKTKQLDVSRIDNPKQFLAELGINKVDVIIGGPPCTGFARVGKGKINHLNKQAGRDEKQEDPYRAPNKLYKDFVRFVRDIQPLFFIMENVPDMGPTTISEIKQAFKDIHYEVDAKVLEGTDYGVYQTRKRLFFQGNRINATVRWPEPTTAGQRLPLRDAIGDLPRIKPPSLTEKLPYRARKLSPYQQKMRAGMGAEGGYVFDHIVRPHREDDVTIFKLMKPGDKYTDISEDYRRYRSDTFKDKYRKLRWCQPCCTVTAHMCKDGYRYIHPDRQQHRTLSVRESARVQGFPDRFKFAGHRSNRYWQIGNAVPPPLAEAIAGVVKEDILAYQRSLKICSSGMVAEQTLTPQSQCDLVAVAPDPSDKDEARRTFFRDKLLKWGGSHFRNYPWRLTKDPYQILIAEMLLRRTKADQVVPVYERFIKAFPEPQKLAEAASSDIYQLLQPLGLNWRQANIIELAKVLVRDHNGVVPSSLGTLAKLPGVGEYVASAVCCFAFGQAVPLIDTNTVRVACRFLGLQEKPEGRRNPAIRVAIASLVDGTSPRQYHWALLDFAAAICRARNPLHSVCPVAKCCLYFLSTRDTMEETNPVDRQLTFGEIPSNEKREEKRNAGRDIRSAGF